MGNSNERVLGRWGMLATGVGYAVGAGVVTLVGQAIGITGYSATIAYAVAIIFGLIYDFPVAIATGAVSLNGGNYSLISAIVGKYWGGLSVCSGFLSWLSIALYAVSFAVYVQSLFPNVPVLVTEIIILTLMYVMNLFGMKNASALNNFLSVSLLAGLGSFVIIGLQKADLSLLANFENPNYMIKGKMGIFTAAAVLMYSTYGHFNIMSYARYCKNPKKDIPFAILGTSAVIAVLYCSIMAVASTVLPLEEVINQPLTNVARAIMPEGAVYFFVVFGPMAAILTTAQGRFVGEIQAVISATNDGWFPKSWNDRNKHGARYKFFTAAYIVALIPLFLGWDINTITRAGQLVSVVMSILFFIALSRIPRLYSEAWKNREFAKWLPTKAYYIAIIGALCVQFYISGSALLNIKPYIVIGSAVITVLGLGYCKWRVSRNEITTADISKIIDEG